MKIIFEEKHREKPQKSTKTRIFHVIIQKFVKFGSVARKKIKKYLGLPQSELAERRARKVSFPCLMSVKQLE